MKIWDISKKTTFGWLGTLAVISLCVICWSGNLIDLSYDHSLTSERHRDVLDQIDIDCDPILRPTLASNLTYLKNWKFDITPIEENLANSTDVCAKVRELFYFPTKPLSKEEAEYPLAYGILVYKNPVQVLFMLSSFYHPQNEYCMAVSNTADDFFKKVIGSLPDCFDNIHVLHRPNITWGSFEIINSTYACLEALSNSSTPWKYFQYLAGVDVPLKTNREMVAIFKTLNGTANVDVNKLPKSRMPGGNEKFPLTLHKSSLSVLIPRPAADRMVQSSIPRKLLNHLNGALVPDETFWGTLTGNPKEFPIAGGFDGESIIGYMANFRNSSTQVFENYVKMWKKPESIKVSNYISRLQYWLWQACKGKMVLESCVFGVEDVPHIIKQPHLVAHKMYFDTEPAAPICMLKEIRHRANNPAPFDLSYYEELPMVEMKRGVPLKDISHPDWLYVFVYGW